MSTCFSESVSGVNLLACIVAPRKIKRQLGTERAEIREPSGWFQHRRTQVALICHWTNFPFDTDWTISDHLSFQFYMFPLDWDILQFPIYIDHFFQKAFRSFKRRSMLISALVATIFVALYPSMMDAKCQPDSRPPAIPVALFDYDVSNRPTTATVGNMLAKTWCL